MPYDAVMDDPEMIEGRNERKTVQSSCCETKNVLHQAHGRATWQDTGNLVARLHAVRSKEGIK